MQISGWIEFFRLQPHSCRDANGRMNAKIEPKSSEDVDRRGRRPSSFSVNAIAAMSWPTDQLCVSVSVAYLSSMFCFVNTCVKSRPAFDE